MEFFLFYAYCSFIPIVALYYNYTPSFFFLYIPVIHMCKSIKWQQTLKTIVYNIDTCTSVHVLPSSAVLTWCWFTSTCIYLVHITLVKYCGHLYTPALYTKMWLLQHSMCIFMVNCCWWFRLYILEDRCIDHIKSLWDYVRWLVFVFFCALKVC